MWHVIESRRVRINHALFSACSFTFMFALQLAQNQTLRDARLKDTDFLVLKKVHRRGNQTSVLLSFSVASSLRVLLVKCCSHLYIVPDTSPSGSSSSRSQEQHHFVMYQQPQGSAFSPLAADQAAVSDQQRVSQEDEDEADDEDDEGPEGRLILDDDEDSEHETVSRKTSGASDASSTATIREGIGAFSLGNHSQSHFSPFSQLAQTAAEEDRKLEAARQLERLSAGMAVSEGGSHRAGAFHAHLGSLPFPYGFPPVYRLAVSSPTAHGANVSSHQLTAPVITPATSYLLSNPYAATLLGYPTPGVIRHPFLPSPSLYGLPPLLAVSQQVCGPAAHSVGGVTPTSSVYQGVRAASNLPPAQRVSPPADSTVSSTQGNAIVSSPTSSQNDKRRGASALYKSLPRSKVFVYSVQFLCM